MNYIVVTGATGFLGSTLVAQLRELGRQVKVVSRRHQPGVLHVNDYADTPCADIIIHLAEDPDRSRVNRLGVTYSDHAAHVVRMLANRCRLLVYASSGVVYGDRATVPYTTDMPVSASDVYSQSKLRNEQIVLQARGIVARLSNLYGPGMSKSNVLSDILRQLPGSSPIQIRDGGPVRDFLPVTDAANALAMMASSEDVKIAAGILNVGSGFGLSIRGLTQLALQATGQTGRGIVATQPNFAEPLSFNVLDIAETQRLLGWAPACASCDQLRRFFQDGVRLDD